MFVRARARAPAAPSHRFTYISHAITFYPLGAAPTISSSFFWLMMNVFCAWYDNFLKQLHTDSKEDDAVHEEEKSHRPTGYCTLGKTF